MQKFEQIIRQALSKIDASNPKMRQKIYENIWFIQEKTLATCNLSKEQKQERRNRLTALLKNTEADYRIQYAVQPKAKAPQTATRQRSSSTRYNLQKSEPQPAISSTETIFSQTDSEEYTDYAKIFAAANSAAKDDFIHIKPHMRDQKHHPKREKTVGTIATPPYKQTDFMPQIDPPTQTDIQQLYRTNGKQNNQRDSNHSVLTAKRDDHNENFGLNTLGKKVNRRTKKAEKAAPAYRRKTRFRTFAVSAVSVLVAAFVVWSFYNSFGGSFSIYQSKHKFSGLMQLNSNKNGWVEIFSPANATGLTLKGAATANLHNEPDAHFIRIATKQPGDAIVLDIGQGALIPLRGKIAVFNLIARSAENIMGHLKITADFGSGKLKNYNFELSPTTTMQTFSLTVPRALNSGVKFYLSSDISAGKPHQIDIFSLFVRGADAQGH